MRYPSFIGPSYESQSKIAASDRLVNWYLEKMEVPGQKAEYVAYPAPGFQAFATPGTPGRGRGIYMVNGRVFAVVGSKLYEVYIDGTIAERGTGLNDLDGSPVTWCSNGDGGGQIGITACSKFYVYDLDANTLSFVLDGPTHCGLIDGFALVVDPQTSSLKWSALEDFATFDPLDVAQRNDAPDRWGALVIAHKEAWLFGSETTSVYYNQGGASPFAPNPSIFIGQGTAAPAAVAVLDGSPIWLGQNQSGGAVVYMANGYTPIRVSTHALEYAFSTYDTITDAQAWTYQDQGHSFFVLTFPTAAKTWVYDATAGAWHERGSWDGADYAGLSVHGHVFAWGRHLTVDRSTGTVYRMGVDLTSDVDGAVLRRMRRAPHLFNENKQVFFDRLEVHLETGLGLSSGQGSDPQAMLRWSNDGGQTWGSERWVSAGIEGAYSARVKWHKLGMARDRVFELVVSDPIPWRLVDAFLDLRLSGC